MDLAFEIKERAGYLPESKQRLILEIINNVLPDGDDEILQDDLYYLEMAERELACEETISHNDIKWK